MLKKPCTNCPFLKEGPAVRLTPGRIDEVWRSTDHDGPGFPCHKTVDYENGRTSGEQSCMGAILSGLKSGKGPHQVGRVILRFGSFTQAQIDELLPTVFGSKAEMKKTALKRGRST